MNRYLSLLLLLVSYYSSGAESVNIHGIITNEDSAPVSGAVVTLLGQNLKDTTETDGSYAIIKKDVAVLPSSLPNQESISFKKGILELDLVAPSPVSVEIFDMKGSLLDKEVIRNASAGIYRLNMAKHAEATELLVIHASIGRQTMTFRYLPLLGGINVLNTNLTATVHSDNRLAKITAKIDSLEIVADGYIRKVISIDSYDSEINETLTAEGNEPVCEGCGKTDHPESGKYTMDVNGTEREYLLKLPDDYEPGKQYKLIFCPHWMGGTIDQVVSGQMCGGPFYGLESRANGTAIFAVPQGLKSGSSTGFPNTNGQDIAFFRAMLDHFNSTLCIDQKRIFSTGFSYGGMMSFAVGCAMNDLVRAIAPMSGAFYSGCDSSSQGPIAVFQIHGDHDKVVPVANARTARNYFLARNGCDPNSATPVEPGPYCVQYDCLEGYPQVYCEFDLEEEPTESRHHGVRPWAADAIWDFFSQF